MEKTLESEEEFTTTSKDIVDPNYNPEPSEPTRVRNIHKIHMSTQKLVQRTKCPSVKIDNRG